MYYRLGSIDKDFDFIYDSSDSSCELVSHKELVELGVVFEDKFYIYDYSKFKIIYGSKLYLGNKVWNRTKLFDYALKFGENYDAVISVNCHVTLAEKDVGKWNQFLDSHIILIELVLIDVINTYTVDDETTRFTISTDGLFRDILWKCCERNTVMFGVSIPVEMLDYMLRLIISHNIFVLSKMFDGYLIDKMILVDIVDGKKYYCSGYSRVSEWYV